MLIGIDASRANKERKTGTEWYSFYLIKHLAQIDSKNQYILYSDKPLKSGLINLIDQDVNPPEKNKIEFDERGFQKIYSPYNNFKGKILKWPFSFFWTMGRLSWEMIFNKPEVLFVPSHSLPLVGGKKTINTIHDLGFERDDKIYRKDEIGPENKLLKKFLNLLIKLFTLGKYSANSTDHLWWSVNFALKKATKIITVSNFSKNEIKDFYGDEKNKVVVVYNGFNSSLYKKINNSEAVDNILKKYGVSKPYFLYIGRIEKKKNISLLIESFANMKQANKQIKENLVLIGNAGFGYDEVEYMIHEFNLMENVFMPGWVEEDDLPYFYNGATAFVFPSKYEGFGIPILQAMACGTPTVISDIPPFREVAQESACYFNPCDMISISKAMNCIVVDKNLRIRLVDEAQKIIKNFSWEKCAKDTLKVIEKL